MPSLWQINDTQYLYMGLSIIGFALCAKFLHHIYINEISKMMILILLAVISLINTNNIIVFLLLVFIAFGNHIDIEKVIKINLLTKCVCLFAVIYLALSGTIQNLEFAKDGYYISAYGFKNPNLLAAVIFEINLMLLYFNRNKIGFFGFFLFVVITGINFYLTRSRTPLYSSLIVFILFLLYKLLMNKDLIKSVFFKKNVIMGFKIFTVLLFLLVCFNINFFIRNGELLSSRFQLVHTFVTYYGLTLLGQEVMTVAGRTLDFGYVYLLLTYGILYFFLFVMAYAKALNNAYLHNDLIEMLVILAFLLYGIGETTMLRIEYNFTLLFLVSVAWNSKYKRE